MSLDKSAAIPYKAPSFIQESNTVTVPANRQQLILSGLLPCLLALRLLSADRPSLSFAP